MIGPYSSPPRFGGEPFLRHTEGVPAPSIEGVVFVSTVNNAMGCETAIFLGDKVIWRQEHTPRQDLAEEHGRIVAATRGGSLDLWSALKGGQP